jgi:exosortase/archaeosortase family protein
MFSGLLGPRIISGGLVNKYGFNIYGSLGKTLLFSILAFSVLAYRRLGEISVPKWQSHNIAWLVASAASFCYAWLGVSKLLSDVHGLYWPVLTNVMLIASVIFALGGSFGPATLRNLVSTYKRELELAGALAIGFYGFLYVVYGLWRVLSATVMYVTHWLLALTGLHSQVILPRTLLFDKFGIQIAQYCSGIESIALFTGLYVVFGLMDWRRFNHRRYLGIFPFALLILFGFNILRVAVLILAGYYINPHIAFSLFHTYAGMVFFILYSGIFWAITYKWMLRSNNNGTKHHVKLKKAIA